MGYGRRQVIVAFSLAIALGACKTSAGRLTSDDPTGDAPVVPTTTNSLNLIAKCRGQSEDFDMSFLITGLSRVPDDEAQVVVDVTDHKTGAKVVQSSAGRGFYGPREYLYVRYDVGSLTLDWIGPDNSNLFGGAATVNADPAVTAIEVRCTTQEDTASGGK